MELIDTHCHLDIERHFPDYLEVMGQAQAAGVCEMVLAGVNRQGWNRLLSLSRDHSGLHAAPGLHPLYLNQHQAGDIDVLKQITIHETVVAIGEVGLDYYPEDIDRKMQQDLFEAQIDIAQKAGLPLLLHVRKAHDQVVATLRRKGFDRGGIVHAFGGSFQQANHYLKLGFIIGIGGTVTYDRSRKIRKVASQLPLSGIVLETDSPDIPPSKYRDTRNVPANLVEVLRALTLLRSEGAAEIALQTNANARRILSLDVGH